MTHGTADPGDGKGAKSTLASSVYQQLRDDLLRGALEAESKLRVELVVSRYGAGASPVREALNCLAAEGLLDLSKINVATFALADFRRAVDAAAIMQSLDLTAVVP